MVEKFVAPKFELKPKRSVEIQFRGTLAAGAIISVVSGAITYPFRITRLKMIFSSTAGNLVEHKWFIDRNPSGSTTGEPSGDELLRPESSDPTFIGSNLIRVVDCNVEVPESPKYLKLYTNNGSGAVYYINGSATIEEL